MTLGGSSCHFSQVAAQQVLVMALFTTNYFSVSSCYGKIGIGLQGKKSELKLSTAIYRATLILQPIFSVVQMKFLPSYCQLKFLIFHHKGIFSLFHKKKMS